MCKTSVSSICVICLRCYAVELVGRNCICIILVRCMLQDWYELYLNNTGAMLRSRSDMSGTCIMRVKFMQSDRCNNNHNNNINNKK